MLELLADGTIGMGRGCCEQRWQLSAQDGKLQLWFLDEARHTVELEPEGEGFRGHWLVFEKMPIHLEPANVTSLTNELEQRPEDVSRSARPEGSRDAEGALVGREELARYWEEGFLVIPAVVPAGEVEAFRQVIAMTPHLFGSVTPHRSDPFWAYMAKHPRITRVVASLIGGVPRIVQSVYFVKPPRAPGGEVNNATPLHQDRAYLPNRPNTLIGAWLALTDTDPVVGGFRLVPRSHHWGIRERGAKAHPAYQPIWLRSPEGREWLYAVPDPDFSDVEDRVLGLTIPAGSVVFFDGLVIHGAYGNWSTDRTRESLVTHYVRDGSWVYVRHLQDTVAAYPADGGPMNSWP